MTSSFFFCLSIGYIYISTMTVVILSCPSPTAGNQLFCSYQTLEAVEGGNFSVTCHVDPKVNLSGCTVDVKRIDLPRDEDLICSCRGGKENHDDQSSQYKNRASLNCEDLDRQVTLRISSVQQSDSGQYKIYVPRLGVKFTFNLTLAVNESSTTRPPADNGTETNKGDPPKTKLSRQAVIGISTAVAVVVGAVVAAATYLLKKLFRQKMKLRAKKSKGDTEQNDLEMVNMMDQMTEGGGLRCSSPQ